MKKALAWMVPLVIVLGGCPKSPSQAPKTEPAPGVTQARDPALDVALMLVSEGRSEQGMPASRLDLDVVADMRQVEAARAAHARKASPEQVAQVFKAAAPPPAPVTGQVERGARYAARVSSKLRELLKGSCKAELEEVGLELRVSTLTAPLPGPPEGAEVVLARLREAFKGAKMVALRCEQGSVGMLLVPKGDGSLRLVDVVPTGTGQKGPPVPLTPPAAQ